MTTPPNRRRFLATLGGLIATPFIAIRAMASTKPTTHTVNPDDFPVGIPGHYAPGMLVRIVILPTREVDENGVQIHFNRSLAIKSRQCGVKLWGAS